MKCLLSLLAVLIFSTSAAFSQLKHSIALHNGVYGDHLLSMEGNRFQDNVLNYVLPGISYRVEKDKHSLKLYHSQYFRNNDKVTNLEMGDLLQHSVAQFGLLYGYKILDKNWLAIKLQGGVNYDYNIHYLVYRDGRIGIMNGINEWNLGATTEVNFDFNIWKGFFIPANIRYTYNPFTDIKVHKQFLFCDIGLGYKIQRNKKKVYNVIE